VSDDPITRAYRTLSNIYDALQTLGIQMFLALFWVVNHVTRKTT
jgi:hypothetical protein